MIQEIDNWLRDQKRKYAFGLLIFLTLASSDIKKKYSEFLACGDDEEVKPSDPRFPMLINKVTNIYNIVKLSPEKYAEALKKLATPLIRTTDQVKEIVALKESVEALQDEITELEESEEDKTAEIVELSDKLVTQNEEIDKLKELLKAKGIKVMDGIDLPKTIKTKYDRIKEITPLMAAIHNELKDTALTDDQRKEKAFELCKLDDERRAYWDDIDAYLNEYSSVLAEEKKVEYSDDPLVRGMQMANRIKRLKENIRRNQESAEAHKANGKPNLEEKALKKVADMTAELEELTNIVNEKK